MYALGMYGGEGSGDGKLRAPHGIAATPGGLVLVADTGNRRVVVLTREGQYLSQTGTLGAGLSEPWDVALDGSGAIFVTDRAGGRMLVYDSLTDTLPDAVELDMPRGVAATSPGPWTSDHGTFQAVVVSDGGALVRIDDGGITASVTPSDCGGSTFNYAEIDYFGNVWDTDSISCQVHKFTPDLFYLESWGEPGSEDHQLDHPTGIAVWDRFGQLFVAESEGARYFWVGSDIRDIDFSSTGTGFTVTGVITENSNVRASVLSPEGDEVATAYDARAYAGELAFEWDGTDNMGRGLPAGEYSLSMVIEPTYSSRGYFEKTFRIRFPFEGTESGSLGERGRGI
jgi:hypothetical protein